MVTSIVDVKGFETCHKEGLVGKHLGLYIQLIDAVTGIFDG